ncbi:MAG: hypothetical protein IIU55_00055 [Paludibacteraceae bacterium]|nr:hypothetical protein [Paludibacteraceae bacterium]
MKKALIDVERRSNKSLIYANIFAINRAFGAILICRLAIAILNKRNT